MKEVKISRKQSTRHNFPSRNLVALSYLETAQTKKKKKKSLEMQGKNPLDNEENSESEPMSSFEVLPEVTPLS